MKLEMGHPVAAQQVLFVNWISSLICEGLQQGENGSRIPGV